MSNYWKKKLDELEKSKAQNTAKKTEKTDYWQNKMTELEKAEDIAPVKKTEIAPVAEEKDDRKWFQKGLFEDGYQFGDITKTILGTGEDVSVNAGTGIVGMGEKIVDALSTLGATMNRGTMMQAAQDEMIFNTLTGKKSDGVLERYQGYQKQVEDETAAFVAKDLYDEEAIAKKIVGTSINSKVLRAMGAEDEESFSVLGEKSDSLVQSAGQLGATAALQAVGVPWWLTTGATTFGAEAESAFNQGADFDEAVLSSAISAGAEILTEKISGGISFGGGALDDVLTKELGRAISNKTVRILAKMGVDMVGEGAEEVLSGVMSAIGQKMTYADEKDFNELFSSEDAFEAFIGGAVLGGGSSVVNTVKANSKGVDAVTGFTETEQKVVDKVYQDAVAEAEKDGKITEKEKRKIYDQVMNDFEKGYISTDTIEETLGGDTYKTYRDTVDSEDALREEFDTLNQMKQGEMTGEQMDRRTELKQQLEDLKTNSQRDQLKAQLSDEVFNLAKDTRLAESYNEQSRRGNAFEADLSKYDTKQQAVVQKAIDSGILNNTNRTHEFVDMIAKISADKGVSFDFTNNEKLKESGYAVDGATVNGYVTKDGITLNIDSSKATRSVAGHEITHILEGTELYTELQNTIFEYAKSKGEYDSRLATLTKLYANVEGADVNAELTADLVGDYLFDDVDFVRKLSVEHRNVFEKIYDEIKYLVKVATAGSKEARELEKVKKAFEDAYRAETKNTVTEDGVSYALADVEQITPSDERKTANILEVAKMESVYTVDESKLVDSGKDIKEIYGEFFSAWGENIHSDVFGDVAVKKSSIRSEIRHGSTAEKIASIEAIPSVIENGKVVEWMEKATGSFRIVVAAPIRIGNTPYYMGVMLQRDSQSQRLYLHDVAIEKEVTDLSQDHLVTTGPHGESENLFTTSILQKILDVKGKTSNSNPDVKRSISADGKTRRYSGDAPMTALRLETGETAPVAETVAENAKAADVAPVQYDIDDAPAAEEDVAAMAEESFAALDDTDAPPEVEAPYYGESKPERANDPFLNRDWDERKTKAFTTDNPDAKPFFQEAAQKLAEDFAYTQPAERGFNAEQYYNSGGEAGFYGWGRKAADDINALMDVYGLSYAQIEEGLDAIIHDTPKVNNKPAKTIEFILNDRMLKGTKMWYSGEEIPPHQGYIEWLNGQQNAAEYGESIAALTDVDAPADIAPAAKKSFPSVLYNMREGANGWGKIYPVAWEALYDAVKNTNSEFLDAYAEEEGVPIESGSNRIVVGSSPIDDAFATMEDAVRQEAITPMQGAQLLNEAYKQGGVDALKNLRYLDSDSVRKLAERITEAPMQESLTVEDVMPIAEAPVAQQYEAIKPKREKEPSMARATPAEQARADILTEEPKADKKKGGVWSKIKNNVLDKGMVFEDLSLATGNRELQARWNSIRYAEGKAQRLMGEGNASVKSLSSIRDAVEKTGKTQQFYEYLYHLHNVDRMTLAERYEDVPNKTVFGDAVTADVSRAAVAELENDNPEFKQHAQDVYDYMTYLRGLLVEGGVISNETAKLWQEMYPHYVPIRRLGDEGLNINVPLDTGRTGVNAPIKRAKGGNRDILPLFDTMGQRTIQTFKAIAKNRFGVELKNTLGTTIESDALGVDDAIDSIDTQEGLLQEGKGGKKPTFTVFENGEKVTFEITDEMYDAMKPTSDGLAYTNKVLHTVGNIRRGTLTEYNPWFMLKNAVKDVQDVLVNSQHAVRTYAAIPKAIKQMATKGHWYQEYLDNGGEQNTYFDNETNTFAKENKALEIAKKVTGLDAISKANNIIERLPRLAEYIASREAGRSVDVSMLDAARVTTNFAAGGDLTKFANRNGATFLNASIQGAIQQARNIREAKANGLKGWAKLAGVYTLAGLPAVLLNGLIWDDDEEYEELSDYVKQNYYIVGKFGDGNFVRIPKGRTVAVIQSAFEQMGNAITGDDEADLKSFVDLVVNNLAPNNPVDNNILSPIIQVANNETWYGEDLVPTRLQDLPAAEQYDESTDSISRWLGEATNTSPYKWNYLLDQYSGVIGDTFLPMLTPEAESGDNSFEGNMIAPLKDMFTTDSVMNNQNVSDFYDTVDELTTNAKGSKATEEDVLKYKYMNSVNADLGELYGQKREIQSSDLPDDIKYNRVREIQRQIDEMAEEALSSYGGASITGDYATVGDRHYHKNDDGEWVKVSDEQLEKQDEVTGALGISPDEYWGSKEEYDYAYKNPGKYAIAKAVGGYSTYRGYSSKLYDIKADKDEDGESISGSAKEKKMAYIESLDLDYGQKLILHRSMYDGKEDKAKYNQAIVEYLDSREDISWEDMKTILEELDFTVYDDGRITW